MTRGRKEEAPIREARGALVTSVRVDFTAKGEVDLWRNLARKVGSDYSGPKGLLNFGFVALPEQFEPGALYLTGNAHSHEDEPGTTHWSLWLRTVPRTEPPIDLRKRSEKVGGMKNLLTILAEEWPSAERLKPTVVVSYGLDTTRWSCPLVLPAPDTPPVTLGRANASVSNRQVEWKIRGAGPLREVTDIGAVVGKYIGLRVSGETTIGMSDAFLDRAERTLWNALKKYFLSKKA